MDLTICTVNFKSRDYLEVNNELIKKLNPDLNIKWSICDNSPVPEVFSFDAQILPAVQYDQNIPNSFVNKHSYHHAAGLDSLIPHIKTRYVLFTDGDFFRLRSFDTIILHMDMHDLAAFGSGYFPDGKKRIANVPVAFDMLVDTTKFEINKYSFRPNGVGSDGTIKDTGYSIYKELKSNYSIETTEPQQTGLFESYFWRKKLYGIHLHSKLHLREGEKLKSRIKEQLTLVRELI